MPSNDEIQATLCAPGQFFEVEILDIGGVPTRAWKNAPRTLDVVLVHGAAAAGARDFLVLDEERISHEWHLRLVERFAASLVELGVRKGDRVALAMRNLPEWSIAFFGAAMAGAIAVPINAFGTGEELGVEATMVRLAVAGGCSTKPTVTAPFPDARHLVWPCTDNMGLELWRIIGGGHTWPGVTTYVDPNTARKKRTAHPRAAHMAHPRWSNTRQPT